MTRLVPSFLIKLVGQATATIVCAIVTVSAYVLLYRVLDAYAPFEVDLLIYGVAVILFHFGLMTLMQIRSLED